VDAAYRLLYEYGSPDLWAGLAEKVEAKLIAQCDASPIGHLFMLAKQFEELGIHTPLLSGVSDARSAAGRQEAVRQRRRGTLRPRDPKTNLVAKGSGALAKSPGGSFGDEDGSG